MVMAKEGTTAWYYEQAIRMRVLAAKATNPQIQFELMQAATRFRILASDIEIEKERRRRAQSMMAAATEPVDGAAHARAGSTALKR